MKLQILNIVATFLMASHAASAAEKLQALIIDGQNNHDVWPKSTIIMRDYLRETGLYDAVDVARTKYTWKATREAAFLPLAGVGETEDLKKPKTDPDFKPDFAKYDVVISNFGFNAAPWPKETQESFEKYVRNGGGFVSVHAADNCFGDWVEYNEMIGLGGWGGRNEKSGPYVYINAEGEVVRDDSKGPCGTHGPRADFLITMRNLEHPVSKGLPDFWMHAEDECYSMLRGPAKNMEILATAADTPKLQKAGRNEPMLMVIDYHKGRVFHTTLGHDTPAFECVGFITTFKRGVEWAATGKVTQDALPANFPTAEKVSKREYVTPAK